MASHVGPGAFTGHQSLLVVGGGADIIIGSFFVPTGGVQVPGIPGDREGLFRVDETLLEEFAVGFVGILGGIREGLIIVSSPGKQQGVDGVASAGGGVGFDTRHYLAVSAEAGGSQHGDNRDHDEEFDQGKAPVSFGGFHMMLWCSGQAADWGMGAGYDVLEKPARIRSRYFQF